MKASRRQPRSALAPGAEAAALWQRDHRRLPHGYRAQALALHGRCHSVQEIELPDVLDHEAAVDGPDPVEPFRILVDNKEPGAR